MSSESFFHVAIVGGGACGLAVLIQIVERGSPGTRVIILEKQASVGPGLAYSSACVGTRVNMHAKSMSLYANDTEHFARWLKTNPSNTPLSTGGDEFPPREHFGEYLKETMSKVIEDARSRDVHVVVRQTEVIDMKKHPRHWAIHSSNDTVIEATDVVLAVGNHMSQIYKHLNDKPLYFSNPWPNSRLTSEIPKTASIAILGSRLTAIDEVLYLTDRGYTGQMYLLSRSGQLPKVQAVVSKRHARVFAMYNLARELENNPRGAIITLVRRLHEEMVLTKPSAKKQSWVQSLPPVLPPDDMTSSFRQDVEAAARGDVPGQTVLRETAFVIERYWQCLDEHSRHTFMKEYMSTWVTHRHAMPLRTGQRLLRLLEKGQVKVLRVETKRSVSHTGAGFSIPVLTTPGQSIHVDALVEATGIEYDATRIDSRLMRSLLSQQILTPNPAGGVNVDHETLKVDDQQGLYVLGSMTRGVHFYSTAIDRNVPHAERVADSIFKLPPRKPLHVALFVGTDIYSNLVASTLIPRLIAAGHVPFIYSVASEVTSDHRSDATAFELRESTFYEQILLQETIIPYLSRQSQNYKASRLTIDQLAARHGLLLHSPVDPTTLENSEFQSSLSSNYIDLGFIMTSSLPPRFPRHALSHFQSRGGLFNLNTGALPRYRGIYTAIRAMANGERDFGYSLQEIVSERDSDATQGAVVDVRKRAMDGRGDDACMLNYLDKVWDLGVDILADCTDRIARGMRSERLGEGAAKATRTASWGVPTRDDLSVYHAQGLRLVDGESLKVMIVKYLAPEGEEQRFRELVEDACAKWYAENEQRTVVDLLAKTLIVESVAEVSPISSLRSSSEGEEKLVDIRVQSDVGVRKRTRWSLSRRLSAWGQNWIVSKSRV